MFSVPLCQSVSSMTLCDNSRDSNKPQSGIFMLIDFGSDVCVVDESDSKVQYK